MNRSPSPAWTAVAGLAMAATLFVDGVLMWAVISYMVNGLPLTTADWIVSGLLVAAIAGALVVLLRLIRRQRPGWLALLVLLVGLAFPGAIALILALSGPPFVS
jgi:hypothetical protein